MTSSLKLLLEEKQSLEQQLNAVTQKLSRVNAAIEALTAGDFFDEMAAHYATCRSADGTLKQMAFTVLFEAGRPLTAEAISGQIEHRFRRKIPRTSMSPQLSRLGQSGILRREGNKWSVAPNIPGHVEDNFLLRDRGPLV